MKKIFFLATLLLISLAFAHEAVEPHHEESESALQETNLVQILLIAFAIVIAFTTAAIALRNKASDLLNKVFFTAIALTTVTATIFLVWTIVTVNVSSATGGPVHWHADLEIWACGERTALQKSSGLSNKVGTSLFHHHNDARIHIEGVIRELEDINLGKFFQAIGGEFTNDSLTVILENGDKRTWRNGMLCNGNPATLKMFVNGVRNDRMNEYVIAPHGTVPPGDFIKIVFDET